MSTCGCTSMHFGENQLSPNSISFSLLSAPHPGLFQQSTVGSSTTFHRGFNLDTDRSSGFGSVIRNLAPYSDLVSLRLRSLNSLTLLRTTTRRLILQKAYRHTHLPLLINRTPIACRHTGSGLFIPLPGCFSPFPLGTFLYRSSDMFSLGAWSPQFQPEFHVLRPTQVLNCSLILFAYGTFTLFGQLFQYCSAKNKFGNCMDTPQMS